MTFPDKNLEFLREDAVRLQLGEMGDDEFDSWME